MEEKNNIITYVIVLLVSALWMLIIFIAPLLQYLPHKFEYVSDYYYYLFHFTCHQKPCRSYWLFNVQLPVCVRCLSIYLGFFLGAVIYPLIKKVGSSKMPSLHWLIPCFVPIGIDGISQLFHLYPSPHWLRLITGLLCGGISVFFIIPGFNEAIKSLNK